MTLTKLTTPRIVDFRSSRRPGGAQGAPDPGTDNWPQNTTIVAWLTSGDVVHLGPIDVAPPAPETAGVPWKLIKWWAPI